MALTEEKVKEMEANLREAELMDADDNVEEYIQGDLWSFTGQTRGWFYFTHKRMIFAGGLLGVENFSIAYTDIKEVKKCMISLFIPTGILISAEDPKTGKVKKYKCSVMKRDNWIEFLTKKSGVSCN